MDRVAVMVDAGYFFAAGSALVSGTAKQKRSLLSLNDEAAIAALKQLALDVTGGMPLPREFDSKLLARSREALGRDLNLDEKRYVRDEFRKLIRGE